MKEKPKGVRVVKCPHCDEYELWKEKDKMIVEKTDKKNLYIHQDCYRFFMKEQEVKVKENKQKDELGDFIKSLHNITKIPPNFWFMLEDIRNGTERFKQNAKIQNKQKKGYSYEVILKAYQMAKKKCIHVLKTKNFQTEQSKLVYCLRIAESNLLDAQQKLIQEKRKEKIVELEDQRMVENHKTRKVDYKKKENKHDILDLFE
jgi:hypothetical protein